MLGLCYTPSGDNSCSGALGLAKVCKPKKAPCPLMFYLQRKLPGSRVTTVGRVVPSTATVWQAQNDACTIGPHYLSTPRVTAPSPQYTGLEEEPAHWQDRLWRIGGLWLTAAECVLETILTPFHSPQFTTPGGDGGAAAFPPRARFLAFSAMWRQTRQTDRHKWGS